jgi:acetyltransferase
MHLSKGIGLGNKVDVNESDALSYLAQDEQTKIIGMYLEDVKDGGRLPPAWKRRFAQAGAAHQKRRTPAGASASASHTASLAVADAVFDGVVRQAGAIRLETIDEFIRTLRGFLNLPRRRGPPGVRHVQRRSGDHEHRRNGGLGHAGARLHSGTLERIGSVIATASKMKNPIDIFSRLAYVRLREDRHEVLRALLDDAGVDGVVFISFAEKNPEVYVSLADVVKSDGRKPVFVSLLGMQRTNALRAVF